MIDNTDQLIMQGGNNRGAFRGGNSQVRNYLMNGYFRHRLNFPELRNINSGHFGADKPVITAHRKIIKRSAASKNVPNECPRNASLYDTLLFLIDEFDATGAVEIFRLLLERRSVVPLFIPTFKKHHLDLLRHISWDNEYNSFIACRRRFARSQSQTTGSELLKDLFHIDSAHCDDINKKCTTLDNFTAEICCRCLSAEEKVYHLLVVNVVGDFWLLWRFVKSVKSSHRRRYRRKEQLSSSFYRQQSAAIHKLNPKWSVLQVQK